MIHLQLLWSFIQIGLLSFGGGYAALPLIKNQVVDINSWLSLNEFTDIITISQMTPGPIAINAATFVGMRIAGISGAIIATFGCVLPSFIIVLFLAWFYYKYRNLSVVEGALSGFRPGVVALIGSAALSIFTLSIWGSEKIAFNLSNINIKALVLFIISFIILRKFKPNPIYVIIGSGIVGMFLYLFI